MPSDDLMVASEVEELHREVLGVFGGRRLTKGIASRLDAALSLGMMSPSRRPTLPSYVETFAPLQMPSGCRAGR